MYIIKSATILSLLYCGYLVFLRHETFHRFNRFILLSTLLLSLTLPLVKVRKPVHNTQSATTTSKERKGLLYMPITRVYYPPSWREEIGKNISNRESLWNDLYVMGLAFMSVLFVFRIIVLLSFMRGGLLHSDKRGNTIILKNGNFSPFSIFHYIVMSVHDYEQNRKLILLHEQEHIRCGHTYDLLLMEAVRIIQWFNPFVWLLARDLQAVHEYEADKAVIQQGIDAKQYQQLLVVKSVGNRLQPFANSLRRGSLKKRINMMYQKKSHRRMMLKALFVIPVVATSMVAFAQPQEAVSFHDNIIVSNKKNLPEKPLVEFSTNKKSHKGPRCYYTVNLGTGVCVEHNGHVYVEEKRFRYAFNATSGETIMQLNGYPFDARSLPNLTSKDLCKLEINRLGDKVYVNLVTTSEEMISSTSGNIE